MAKPSYTGSSDWEEVKRRYINQEGDDEKLPTGWMTREEFGQWVEKRQAEKVQKPEVSFVSEALALPEDASCEELKAAMRRDGIRFHGLRPDASDEEVDEAYQVY